jgi:hypothetical protein
VGRPKKEIDREQVLELAKIHCTYAEMAAVLNCNESTLKRRFADLIERGREEGKMSLRRAQFDLALNRKNVAMLIWLGKQILGQTDKVEHQTADAINLTIRRTEAHADPGA